MEEHFEVPGMQEHPEIHITPKYPELFRRMTNQSNGKFNVDKIPEYVRFAMDRSYEVDAERYFEMLLQFAWADTSKNTGLKILEHCCSLEVTHYNNSTCADKALRLLIESRLLGSFMNKSDYHGELILNWICQMPIHSQNRFWAYASKEFSTDAYAVAKFFKFGEWKYLLEMLPKIQAHMHAGGNCTDLHFQKFVTKFLWNVGQLDKTVGVRLMRDFAGEVAVELLLWLLDIKWVQENGDYFPCISAENLKIFDEHDKLLPITADDLNNVFYSHIHPEAKVQWTSKQIMKWLIVCRQKTGSEPESESESESESEFNSENVLGFRHWLRNLQCSGNFLQFRSGSQLVIERLLDFVVNEKEYYDDCVRDYDVECMSVCNSVLEELVMQVANENDSEWQESKRQKTV